MKSSVLTIVEKLVVPAIAAMVLSGSGKIADGQSPPPAFHKAKSEDLTLDDIFPKDRVLDVRITLAEEDWDTIRRQSRNIFTALQEKRKHEPIKGPYTYVNASVTIDGVEFPEVGIRKKGFIGSQSLIRPSLKIKLDYVKKNGELDGLNNLTFNNNQQDSSQLSQSMGYALFNAAGSPAPRCAYAKITVNGKSLGVYSHVETMRKPLIKRGFGNDKGTVYEGTVVDFHESWEGSFEKKFGKEKTARKKIEKLIKVLQGKDGETILSSNAYGRGWVPTDEQQDDKWTAVDFDDRGWKMGRNGAGFEIETGFQSLISEPFDFKAEMYNKSESVYLRFPFEIDDLAMVVSARDLVLRMKYDDGFVAYLNGHKVAAVNTPEDARWNSMALEGHDDQAALRFESINISKHKDKLRNGKNILAIHGLNVDAASTDMLIVAEIQTNDYDYEQEIGKLVDLDAFYTYWAVEGLLGFWDGYSGNNNNFYFYLNPETDKFHFLPWGADALFQKFSQIGYDPRAPLSVKTKGMVAHKLYQLKSGRERYARTLLEILDNHWDEEALLAETIRIEVMLKPHLIPSQVQRIGSIEKIREFIRSRRAELVAEISGGMPLWTRVPEPPPVIPTNYGKDDKSIWTAARKGNIDDVKQYLAKGTDVNAKDRSGGNAMSIAALAGHADIVKFLIEKGGDVNAKNNEGHSALHGASFLGRFEVVQLLLENAADENAGNNRGETPLDSASGEWNQGIQGFIEAILQTKIDPEKVKADRIKVIAQLRKHGAKLGAAVATAGNKPTGTSLWAAAKSGDSAALKKHLVEGDDVNALEPKTGITPLAWAAMAGQIEAAELLIKEGAKVSAKNRDGSTSLHGAAFLGRTKIVELLIKHKVEINSKNSMGETPLGSVSTEWNEQIQGITEFIASILQLQIDVEKIKAARPEIAALLRKHGGKTGEELK